ncbi:MAG TPA: hypothetical protein VN623_11180 [Hyphomicrobium sp.]|jgi:hypothetical protein|uniref:hypothetical protein n=1 Tax=Hyphomicrobium sp. TaxID=82 RepID=UPI002C774F9C|nr:hypothetical protein [Hyphomicrobium sp.]HXE02500.1 hypothetical protein [Hyphomicrobium sp.]
MTVILNLADVPRVDAAELDIPMRLLIGKGQGLALLKGLTEREIRDLENEIWTGFEGSDEARLAVALRFRALLDVFASRRLKGLLLERGFRLIAAAIREASRQPLNTRFGFNAQRLLTALDAATASPAAEPLPLKIAA